MPSAASSPINFLLCKSSVDGMYYSLGKKCIPEASARGGWTCLLEL